MPTLGPARPHPTLQVCVPIPEGQGAGQAGRGSRESWRTRGAGAVQLGGRPGLEAEEGTSRSVPGGQADRSSSAYELAPTCPGCR